MDRPMVKKIFCQALAWAGAAMVCGVIALAQQSGAGAGQGAGVRTDGQIEMDVVHALDASKALKNDMITAATIQSEVTLSGTVASEASSELAEAIAGRVAGVTRVNNHLKVGNPQEAQNEAGTDAQPMSENMPEDAVAPQAAPQSPDGSMAAPDQPQGGLQQQPQGYPQQPGSPQQPPYAQQPGYPPPPRPGYQPMRPPQSAYQEPSGPVTIPQGTVLQVRTTEPVSSKRASNGTGVQFTVIQDVAFGGVLAIPRGATVHGVVTESKKAGELSGSPELALMLTSLDLGGQSYTLETDQFKVKGPSKTGQTVGNAFGGAILGALIGGAVGRGPGAAIGAAAGAGAGTAASAASSGPGVWIPAEARLDFHLTAPVTLTPVNQQEANRLAQGLYQGGPSLYRRGYPAYGRPYYAGYPYGYPPVYYRPYVMMGGYYSWR